MWRAAVLALLCGCTSGVAATDVTSAQLTVEIGGSTIRGCSFQHQQEGGPPFGATTRLLSASTTNDDANLAVKLFHLEAKPDECPPPGSPLWSSTGSAEQTWPADSGPVFAAGDAAGIQADCDSCAANTEVVIDLVLRQLD